MSALQLLKEIREQSTRKNRASDLKRYLITDLEIIEEKAKEAIGEIGWIYPDPDKPETWPEKRVVVYEDWGLADLPKLHLKIYKCWKTALRQDEFLKNVIICWKPAPAFPGYKDKDSKQLTRCMVGRDAECNHPQCPVSEQDIKAGKYCTLPVNDWRE